jgi:hypothetical protein
MRKWMLALALAAAMVLSLSITVGADVIAPCC